MTGDFVTETFFSSSCFSILFVRVGACTYLQGLHEGKSDGKFGQHKTQAKQKQDLSKYESKYFFLDETTSYMTV